MYTFGFVYNPDTSNVAGFYWISKNGIILMDAVNYNILGFQKIYITNKFPLNTNL